MDLPKKITELLNRNPGWEERATELIDHRLGLMTPKQHDYLVREGMINCNEENDFIVAEYPKIRTTDKQGHPKYIDLDGNLDILNQEINNLKANGKNARIVYFPKKYSEYLERKKQKWEQEEEEALQSLVSEPTLEDLPI